MTLIVINTTSGLPRDLTTQFDITVILQIVNFGDLSFRNDTELITADFLAKLRVISASP